jgi:hypothetical protein
MVRERVRGAHCVGAVLRELAAGIEQAEVRIGDQKFDVGKNVVAIADAYPETGELLIVVTGIAPRVSTPPDVHKVERELAYSGD